jgi:hypothetical protein
MSVLNKECAVLMDGHPGDDRIVITSGVRKRAPVIDMHMLDLHTLGEFGAGKYVIELLLK